MPSIAFRKDAAVGVDGITKEQYGQDLESNVGNLHLRLRTMRSRHQPIRRVHVPQGKGKSRPIGISTLEDKIVHEALREVLDLRAGLPRLFIQLWHPAP